MCPSHREHARGLKGMSQVGAIWLVLLSALLGTNLPFVNQRLMVVIALRQPKNLGVRLLELITLAFPGFVYRYLVRHNR